MNGAIGDNIITMVHIMLTTALNWSRMTISCWLLIKEDSVGTNMEMEAIGKVHIIDPIKQTEIVRRTTLR